MARDFFQEALARFRNIQYPTTAQRQFDTLRNDLRKDVLSKEFNEANTRIRELEKEVRTLRRVKHWLICWKVGL